MKFIFLSAALLLGGLAFSQTKKEKLNSILTQVKVLWKLYPAKDFKFFVEDNQYTDQQINVLKDDFFKIRNELLHFLGDSSFTDTVYIVIVDTKEKIKSMLGFEVGGFAISESDIIIFLANTQYSIPAKHELTHYYAYKIWGRPFDNWLSEGLAVYCDNKWYNCQVDSLAKHLKDNNRLFKLTLLKKNFYSLNPMIAYPELGSFTSFLLSTYGQMKFKELWLTGFAKISSVYRKSLKDLEREWLQYLDQFASDKIDYSRHIK